MLEHKFDRSSKTLAIVLPGDVKSTNAQETLEAVEKVRKESLDKGEDWQWLSLDLRKAAMVDSMGLNVFVTLIKREQNRGSKIKVLIKSLAIQRVFMATRMDKSMEMVVSES